VRTFAILAGATALSFAAVGAASAHHSFAMFDNSKKIDYRGVVKKLDWTNPHVWIEVVSGDGADQKTYGFEGGAVSVLKRFGWNRETVKVGDTVTMTAHPYRDGRPGGSIDFVTLADGKKIGGGDGIPGAVVVGGK
jgi:hypothetical protein